MGYDRVDCIYTGSVRQPSSGPAVAQHHIKIENSGYHFGFHRGKPRVCGIATFGDNHPGYDRFAILWDHIESCDVRKNNRMGIINREMNGNGEANSVCGRDSGFSSRSQKIRP